LKKFKVTLLKSEVIKSFLKIIYTFINKIKITKYKSYWLHVINSCIFINFHPVRKISSFTESYNIFTKFFFPKKGNVILDIGSGLGHEMIILSKKVGPKGKIICLEPDSRLFLVLQELVILNKLKNVILYKKLFYHKNNKLVSFYENPLEDWMSNSLFNSKKKNRKHLVETITLDEIIKSNKLSYIDFAKFNIEGSEKYLTRGNVNFLKKCKNIAISCHDFLNVKNKNTFDIIMKLLQKNKFIIKKNNSNNRILKFIIYATKNI
jgi:FkbM family methyltransferase